MLEFSRVCEQIAASTKKTEKTRLIAEYLRNQGTEPAAVACAFLSGRPFPAFEESTLSVGGASIWRALGRVIDLREGDVAAAYRQTGDTGAAAEILLARHNREGEPLSILDVEAAFRQLSKARGTEPKVGALEGLLRRAMPLEAKYILKVITSELRIGSKESLVEDAIALAFAAPAAQVRRANMLLGDIGEVLRIAKDGALESARMRLFHPIGFMLASPAESSEEAFEYIEDAAVEDKYDGVRCQAHCLQGEVRLYSRTLDQITESFPEIVHALSPLQDGVILDGEILAWDAAQIAVDASEAAEPKHGSLTNFHSHARGRALPFQALQTRLGRKRVTEAMQKSAPVAYVVFDVLYIDGELALDAPLSDRLKLLDAIFERLASAPDAPAQRISLFDVDRATSAPVLRAPVTRAASAAELDEIFDAARARGNEGLMIKDLSSSYVPGRRGKSWLKLKRTLATLDVVVTGAEWGNGRKSQWLSDYTFAVRDTGNNDQLVNVGKAYSGVTDEEIQQLTKHFQETVLVDNGHFRTVQPDTVLEVAFNNIQRSDRHESGYALRFPRILRLRTDKSPAEADTLERVREIYESEIAAGRSK